MLGIFWYRQVYIGFHLAIYDSGFEVSYLQLNCNLAAVNWIAPAFFDSVRFFCNKT